VQGSQEDLDNLGTWADAVAAMDNPKYAGVGFACLSGFGIVALDLDHCIKDDVRDPKWDWVLEATYCEVSPSGTGLRAFWMGAARDGKNHDTGVELFHSKGFVTVTGDYYDGGVVRHLSDGLRARLEQLSKPLGSIQSEGLVLSKPNFSGGDRLASNAEHDQRLSAIHQAGLYERDMGGGKHSIRCPFEGDHSDLGRSGGDGDTVYFQPNTNGYPEGWIYCHHTHSNDQAAYWQKIGYNSMNVGLVTDPNHWEEPLPLSTKIDAEDYPISALPDEIRLAVEEVANFTKAPIPLVAASALTAISLAVQAHLDVRRAEKLQSPSSAYFLTIADSGDRKTTCDSYFMQAIRNYEAEQAELAKPDSRKYAADMQAWEAKRSGLKDRIRDLAKKQNPTLTIENALYDLEFSKPLAPRVPKLLHTDITPEKLGHFLANEWPSGGVVSNEAGAVFGSHGMGKDSIMRNLALLNTLWDGGEFSSERKSTEGYTVRGARFTMGLQVQEATLREFFSKSGTLARGTGFLARFLISWPKSNMGKRLFTEAPVAWPHLEAFNRRLSVILNAAPPLNNGFLTPHLMGLSDAAKQSWIQYHDMVEIELNTSGDYFDIRDVAAKSADNAARLAGLFERFANSDGGSISQDSFQRAAKVAAWHLEEAKRFFGDIVLPQVVLDADRLESWLIDCNHKEELSTRYIQRHSPIRDKKRIDPALEELESLNRIKLVQEGKRKLIKVNPMVLQ